VEGEGKRTQPSESEVNMMYRSYADTGGNVNEEIKLLNSISHVSARLARNLSLLAASQSEEGGKEMSKMAEMAQTIEELRTAAASINAAADWLYQQFSGMTTRRRPLRHPPRKNRSRSSSWRT
jgi:rubrerythrin